MGVGMTRVAVRLGVFSGTFLLSLYAMALSALSQEAPALEAFANHPGYSQAALSDDGSHVALAIPEDGGDRVLTMSFTDPNDRKAYKFEDAIVSDLQWHGDEVLIIQAWGRFAAVPQTAARSFIAYPMSNDTPRLIEYIPPVAGSDDGSVSFVWSLYQVVDLVPQEDHFLMAAYVNRQPGMQRFGSSIPNIWGYDLLRTFPESAQARALQQGTEYTGQWITDGSGNLVARVEVLVSGRQVIQVPDGAAFREVGSLDDNVDNRGDIMGLSLDGSSLVVRMRMGNRFGLYPFSLADGSIGAPIYLNPEFDVGVVLRDERTLRVNGIAYQQNMLTRYVYFDPDLEMVQQTLENAFQGNSVAILSRSADGNKILFQVESPTRPPVLGLFDKAASSAQTIVESRPDLVAARHGPVRIVDYRSADGTSLFGRLTLPPDVPEQNLPLVVLEDSASSPTFDVFAQFLAARGYASFRPGIRDLRTLGDVSAMDELNDWVLSRQEDYAAGVNLLIDQGIVDPARVCIFGDGEEAYTALMATILSADLFKCAIATEPITDLKRLVTWARFASQLSLLSYNSPLIRNYDHYAQEDLERLSPLTRAADIGADVLILGYDDDDHGAAMDAALDRAQKPVEFVAFTGNFTDPAEARQENSINSFEAIERYLAGQIDP